MEQTVAEIEEAMFKRLMGERALGAALEALAEAGRKSSEQYWPPLISDILTIGIKAAGKASLSSDPDAEHRTIE